MSARLPEYTVDVGEHVSGFLGGVHQVMDTVQGVVGGQRAGLLVVRVQALLQRIHVVVAAAHQRLARDIVRHRFLGRRKLIVVRPTAGLVDQPAGDATHQQTILDSELDNRVQGGAALLQQLVQLEWDGSKQMH